MITPYKTTKQIYYKKGGKKIIVRDSMECQSCVSGREDVNEKLDRENERDYAVIWAAALSVIIVVYASIGTIKWTISKLGVVLLWWQYALVFGSLWCVVIGLVMYFGMRKAKMNDGK